MRLAKGNLRTFVVILILLAILVSLITVTAISGNNAVVDTAEAATSVYGDTVVDEGYDIIIIAGQSNALGYYSPASEDTYLTPYNKVYAVVSGTSDGEYETTNGIYTVGEYSRTKTNGNYDYSFGETFVEEYAENYLASNRSVLVVKVAEGGTGFFYKNNYWDTEGGSLYESLITQITYALGDNVSGDNRVVGFLWHQGEYDMKNDCNVATSSYSDTYCTALTALIDGVRSTVTANGGTWNSSNTLPVFIGQVSQEYFEINATYSVTYANGYANVMSDIETVVENDDNTYFISSDELKGSTYTSKDKDDGLHFLEAGHIILGGRYMDSFETHYGLYVPNANTDTDTDLVIDENQKTTELSSLDLSSDDVDLIDVYGAVESGTVMYNNEVSGTPISSAIDLYDWLTSGTTDTTNAYLTCDLTIDLSSDSIEEKYDDYKSIASGQTFDGNGYTITFTGTEAVTWTPDNETSYYSFFCDYCEGTIENLSIIYSGGYTYGCCTDGKNNVVYMGGVVGGASNAIIQNVSVAVSGTLSSQRSTYTIVVTRCIGGITGYATATTIKNCTIDIQGQIYAEANATGSNIVCPTYVGGVCGYVASTGTTISNCSVTLGNKALYTRQRAANDNCNGMYAHLAAVFASSTGTVNVSDIILDLDSTFYAINNTDTTYTVGIITTYDGEDANYSDDLIYLSEAPASLPTKTYTSTSTADSTSSNYYNTLSTPSIINLYNYSAPTSISVDSGTGSVTSVSDSLFSSFTISDTNILFAVTQTNENAWCRFNGDNIFESYTGTFSIADIILNSSETIAYEITENTAVVTPSDTDYDKTVYDTLSAEFKISDIINNSYIVARLNTYCTLNVQYSGTNYASQSAVPTTAGTYSVYCEIAYNNITFVSQTYTLEIIEDPAQKTTDLTSLDLSSSASLIDVYGAVESGTVGENHEIDSSWTAISKASELISYLEGGTGSAYLSCNIYIDLADVSYNGTARNVASGCTLEGNGYSIIFYASSDVSISDTISATLTRTSFLIHNVSGTVQNLSFIYDTTSTSPVTYTITNMGASSSQNIQWGGVTAYLSGTIDNVYVYVSDKVTIELASTNNTTGHYAIGGIVGSNADASVGTITNCTVNIEGSLATSENAVNADIGGISGEYATTASNSAVILQSNSLISYADTTSYIGAAFGKATSASPGESSNMILDVSNDFYSCVSTDTNKIGLYASGAYDSGEATPTVLALYLLQAKDDGLDYGVDLDDDVTTTSSIYDLSDYNTPALAMTGDNATDFVAGYNEDEGLFATFTIYLSATNIDYSNILATLTQNDSDWARFSSTYVAGGYTGTYSLADVIYYNDNSSTSTTNLSYTATMQKLAVITDDSDSADDNSDSADITYSYGANASQDISSVTSDTDLIAIIEANATVSVYYSGASAVYESSNTPTRSGTYNVYISIYNGDRLISNVTTYTIAIADSGEDDTQKTTDLEALDLSGDADLIDVYGAVESGTVLDGYYNASGTAISDAESLYEYLNSGTGNAYLTCDLVVDLSTDTNYFSTTAVRKVASGYTLDGNGYTITFSGTVTYTSSTSNNTSFFVQECYGTIKNLTLIYTSTATYKYSNGTNTITFGLLTGYLEGTISNINVSVASGVTITSLRASGNQVRLIGGIAGSSSGGSISNSTVNIQGVLYGSQSANGTLTIAVGGFCGNATGTTISNCAVTLASLALSSIAPTTITCNYGAVIAADTSTSTAQNKVSDLYLDVTNTFFNVSASNAYPVIGLITSGYGYNSASSVSASGATTNTVFSNKLVLTNALDIAESGYSYGDAEYTYQKGNSSDYGLSSTPSDVTTLSGKTVSVTLNDETVGSYSVGDSFTIADSNSSTFSAITEESGSWSRFGDATYYAETYTGNVALIEILNSSASYTKDDIALPTLSYTAVYNGAYSVTALQIEDEVSAAVNYSNSWYIETVFYSNEDRTEEVKSSALIADKTYYVTYSIYDNTNNNFTLIASQNATLAVLKAKVSSPDADSTEFTYDGTAQTYNLATSEFYTINYGEEYSLTQTNAGTYTYTLTLNDSTNYEWAEGAVKTFDFKIAKADYDMTGVSFENGSSVYNGSEQSLSSLTFADGVALNSDITVSYSGSVTNVGSGTITASFETSDANYKAPSSMTATLTITQATNTISDLAITDWTYGDTANAPTATATFGGTITYTYSDMEDGTYSGDVPTDAGTYYVKAVSVADDSAYKNYASATSSAISFTIGQRSATITSTVSAEEIAYYSEAPTYEYTTSNILAADLSDFEISVSCDYEVGSNVDTYTVKISYTANDNYSITTTEVTFKVIQADNEFTEDLAITDWTYGDTVNAPSATATFGGTDTITYYYTSDLDDADWSTTVPTNAGTYYVKAVSVADDSAYKNYASATSSAISFTIGQRSATITSTVSAEEIAYYSEAPTYEYTTSNILAADLSDFEISVSCDYEVGSNVDTYTVKISYTANDNYSITTTEVTFKVIQADNEFTEDLAITDWTYGDTVNAPSATAKFGTDTITYTYSDSENGDYTGTVPTNAGTYYVKASIASTDDYYLVTSSAVLFVISKATVTAPDVSFTETYDGSQVTTDVSADSDGLYTVLQATGLNAGTYTGSVTLEDTANYEWILEDGNSSEALTITLVINQATTTISTTGVATEYTYNGAAQTISGAVANDYFGTIVYTYSTSENGDYTSTAPTDAGTYYVKISVNNSSNYTSDVYKIVKIEVQQAAVSVIINSETITYGDSEPSYTSKVTGLFNSDEITIEYAVSDYEGNVGSYTITATATAGDNYIVSVTDAKLTVSTKRITVTAASATITYGDAAPTASYGYTITSGSLLEADEKLITVEYTCSYEVGSAVGSYNIVPNVTVSSNYNVSIVYGKLTVSAKEITVTADDISISYGNTPTYKSTIVTLVGEDALAITYTVVDSNEVVYAGNVGEYTIAPSATDSNYDITFETGTLTVTKATNSIMFQIGGNSWYYGEEPSEFTVEAMFGEDDVYYVFSTEENGTYTAGMPTKIGTYYAKAVIDETDNYDEITSTSLSFEILAPSTAEPTVIITNWYYGSTANAPTTYVNGEVISATYAYYSDETCEVEVTDIANAKAGTYYVVATFEYNSEEVTATVSFEIYETIYTITFIVDADVFSYTGDLVVYTLLNEMPIVPEVVGKEVGDIKYVFTGWDTDVVIATASVTYTATYTSEDSDVKVARDDVLAQINTISANYTESDYRETEWTAISALFATAKTKVTAMTSLTSIESYDVDALAAKAAAYSTDLQYNIADVVAEINAIADDIVAADYTVASFTALQSAMAADITTLNACATYAELDAFVQTATLYTLVTAASVAESFATTHAYALSLTTETAVYDDKDDIANAIASYNSLDANVAALLVEEIALLNTLSSTLTARTAAIPTANTTVFTTVGKNVTYLPVGYDSTKMTISGNVQSVAGTYTVTVSLIDGCVWTDGSTVDITFTFVLKSAQLNVEENVDDNLLQDEVVITTENGIDPNFSLVVSVITEIETIEELVLLSGYTAVKAFDISLSESGFEVQPDGTITVKILVPEELADLGFEIIHVHDGVSSFVNYEIIDGYAVFETDSLSPFVFVYDTAQTALADATSSILFWIILAVVGALLVGLVSFHFSKK
ncbi:MAG: MBG domain-containing protein [Bacillota bacterium]